MIAPPPASSTLRFALGITGHRGTHSALSADPQPVADAIAAALARIDQRVAVIVPAAAGLAESTKPRLHTLLADGVDQIAAGLARDLGWQVTGELPFGQALNIAVNAQPQRPDVARALLAGKPSGDPLIEQRADRLRRWCSEIPLFELADRDAEIETLLLALLDAPGETEPLRQFNAASSAQTALAGRIMIEQSDLLIGVWDGKSRDLIGGTGHTIVAALDAGLPVLLIDPFDTARWSIVTAIEELAGWQHRVRDDSARLDAVISNALVSGDGARGLSDEIWHDRSSHVLALYRRIETLFGGEPRPFRSVSQIYEKPDMIAQGSGSAMLAKARAMPGADQAFIDAVARDILPTFAWADAVSSWLSDAYRSGMIANFILSALAIVVGVVYLPFGVSNLKWVFAVVELLLLAAILVLTWLGNRQKLHTRWFETRRMAEYLRHAPIMVLTGVARPLGRWPHSSDATWPEHGARHTQRSLGLPIMAIRPGFVRAALADLLAPHVAGQRAYHDAKSQRLRTVDHRLDRLAETMFRLAILSVAAYLLLKAGAAFELVPHEWPTRLSPVFTFVGVALPTMGASIAGIRFFGDFDRFAAISDVTAGKLRLVEARIDHLLAGPDSGADYGSLTKLVHEVDDIVVSEIESWQAVFSGKHITLPA